MVLLVIQPILFDVGEVALEVKNLLKTTKESLYQGIQQAVEGKRVGDVVMRCRHTVNRKVTLL